MLACRLYYMNVYVLYSVAYESRTLKLDCCTTETCKLFLLYWYVYGYILLMFCTLFFFVCVSPSALMIMRGVFLLLLGTLSLLHMYWYWLMLGKTYHAMTSR